MKIRLSLLISIFTLVSCGKITTSDNFTLLLNQSENEWFQYRELKTWKPTQEEIDLTEDMIPQIIEGNKGVYGIKEIYENINDYYYQLVPYIDENNRKIIYINSLCKSFVKNPEPKLNSEDQKKEKEWKSHLYEVTDGGNCFWQVKIDIENKEYFDFSVNGF